MKENKIYNKKFYRINNNILTNKIRLININNKQLGIMSLKNAILIAEYKNTDLIEISPNVIPPIVKLINIGKFKYIKKKKKQKIKSKLKIIQTKEIKFKSNININDINIKLRKIKKILINGNKIKISIHSKGREIFLQKISIKIIEKLKKKIYSLGQIEKKSQKNKNQINILLSPINLKNNSYKNA